MPEIDFLQLIDVLGTAAFAISGARHAIDRKLDVFGVIIIAFVTAIGGGTLRDLLIGNTPVSWMRNELIISVILISCLGTLLIEGLFHRLSGTLFLFDSLGLGLFTIAGMETALQFGFSPGMAIALGTISACFGGVIRDVLLNKVPLIFQKEIYASACIAGGVLYWLLQQWQMQERFAETICIIFIVGIRIIAVKNRLSLPPIRKNTNNDPTHLSG
jgi:uncharacterized membrane protein YeiH